MISRPFLIGLTNLLVPYAHRHGRLMFIQPLQRGHENGGTVGSCWLRIVANTLRRSLHQLKSVACNGHCSDANRGHDGNRSLRSYMRAQRSPEEQVTRRQQLWIVSVPGCFRRSEVLAIPPFKKNDVLLQ